MQAPTRSLGYTSPWLPLCVTTVGTFMSILDANIVNIALPSMLKGFGASLGSGQLVVAAYVIALAVVIPLSGYLGERVGMKRLYMLTLGCFLTGSALCGLAWNVESLVLFRVLQGLGGGMLQPLGMAIVFTVITPIERPKYMALLGLPTLIAPILGPTIGGYIVQYSSWRIVFLMNVPIGLMDIFLAYVLLRETPLMRESKMDFKGFVLAAIAFPSLLFALSQGNDAGWLSPEVVGIAFMGFVALVAFIRHETHHADPMLRLDLFKDAIFRRALLVQWIGFFSLFGLNFLIPLFLQRVHGYGAGDAGRILLPMGLASFVTMNVAGKLYYKTGPRPLVIGGLLVLAATTWLWSRAGPGTSSIWLMAVASGRGFGVGMFGQIVQVIAYNAVPDGALPRATSLVNTCQRIVSAFSTAVLTTVLLVGTSAAGAPAGTSIAAGTAPTAAMTTAFHYVFILMTIFSLAGIGLAFGLRDKVLEKHKAEEAEERKRERAAAAGSAPPEAAVGVR